jgi:hypothetical protein
MFFFVFRFIYDTNTVHFFVLKSTNNEKNTLMFVNNNTHINCIKIRNTLFHSIKRRYQTECYVLMVVIMEETKVTHRSRTVRSTVL